MIVYTAIYGGYDTLKPHPDHDGIAEWICYTDDADLACEGWDVRHEPLEQFPHPRLAAKWWKCHPPSQYESSTWVDGSLLITDSAFFDEMNDPLYRGADIVLFAHPDRTSIIDEAQVSMMMQKYAGLPVMEQAKYYVADWGWPDNELWASTTMARDHNASVLQMGAAWFAENEHWTYQDQISLPPLLRRYQLTPAPLPHSLWRNPWFGFTRHTSDA
jgi:hypothetical protein